MKTRGGNNITHDFSDYKTFKEFFRDLHYRNMSIDEAERRQDKFDGMPRPLGMYLAKKTKYIEAKNRLLNNAKTFYKER